MDLKPDLISIQKWLIKTFLWLLFILSACDTDPAEPDFERVGFDFYPLETGRFYIYEVDEVIHKGANIDPDSLSFQLKEVISEKFLNQAGDSSYILNRFVRKDENEPWELDSVWTARRNQNQLIKVENNVPFVKLAFPVEEGKIWDGNSLNNKKCTDLGEFENICDAYEMIDLNKQFSNGLLDFDNTLTVIQEEDIDPLSITTDDIRKEVYAFDVGLVYKEVKQLSYLDCKNGINAHCCCDNPDEVCTKCAGEIDQGRTLRQVLIEFGTE